MKSYLFLFNRDNEQQMIGNRRAWSHRPNLRLSFAVNVIVILCYLRARLRGFQWNLLFDSNFRPLGYDLKDPRTTQASRFSQVNMSHLGSNCQFSSRFCSLNIMAFLFRFFVVVELANLTLTCSNSNGDGRAAIVTGQTASFSAAVGQGYMPNINFKQVFHKVHGAH